MIRTSIGILLRFALVGLVSVVVATAAIGPIATLSGRTPFIIGGASMAPAIPKGSVVIVDPAARGAPRPGDVATFRTQNGVVVTHRVVRVIVRDDGRWYETKGDANADPDPALWPASSVVGRVVAAVPGLGFVGWLIRQPIGWFNVAVLACWLLLALRLARRPGEEAGRVTVGEPIGAAPEAGRTPSSVRA